MAYAPTSARSALGFAPISPFATLVVMVKNAAKTQANRKALRTLLTLDDCRLTDMGISRADIRDALNGGADLARHRAIRANHAPSA